MLQRERLPYEIIRTACELFAGKTGFTQAEMKSYFAEEVRKVAQPAAPTGEADRWTAFFSGLELWQFERKLRPVPFPTRAEALEYWLALLPLWRQKQLLLELCSKPNFPMSKGAPSAQQRARLVALLNRHVIDDHVTQALQLLDSEYVLEVWLKALGRSADDPGGAITAARTLLESVCKHILEARGSPYDEGASLPDLYRHVAGALNIAPSQQTEQIFKQILGGCQSVVEGIGALRNQLGDAHGKGTTSGQPAPRHAELAVNLAGSTALFLLHTWEAGQDPPRVMG